MKKALEVMLVPYWPRYWILDAGCWILDAGYWILDAGYWILDIYPPQEDWINRDSGFENYLGRYVSHPDKVGTHRGRREKP